ncbi:MAG: hypothetical protein HYZ86_04285 [Candidatus Omnitrophica bacterium]|nr:hypothetical protein [Candidatus Omnitrophota bacterium]
MFMERVFLQDKVPASYQENNVSIVAVVAYIRDHYTSGAQGKYLVAMKRKK